MDGMINLDSDEGVGTTFRLHFKTKEAPKVEEKPIIETFANEPIDQVLGKALVVDDEESIREIISDYLCELGLTITEAANGKEALEKVQKEKFDYVFTDLKMPIMTGAEFIDKSKDIIPEDTIVIVVTGAFPTKKDKRDSEILEQSTHGHINKPFDKEDLYTLIHRVKA